MATKSLLAERIEEACAKRGWNRKKLAEEAQISESTIKNIRYLKHHPTPIVLDRIGKALQIELHERLEDRDALVLKFKAERDEHAAVLRDILVLLLRGCPLEVIAEAACAAGLDRRRLAVLLLQDPADPSSEVTAPG